MIKPIVRDAFFLNQRSERATKAESYETEEGCLSLPGTRKTTRYNRITVRYLDKKFEEHTQNFSGYIAQIIQHECDHLEGILI